MSMNIFSRVGYLYTKAMTYSGDRQDWCIIYQDLEVTVKTCGKSSIQ